MLRGLSRFPPPLAREVSEPVVVGGLGGSGTRAAASVLETLGVFMGRSLSAERDAIPFAAFDVRWGPRYVAGREPGALMRGHHEIALLSHLGGLRPPRSRWGWKHPQVYLQLPFLLGRFPRLRFVHVIRDGRDMAFSTNRNQLELYGALALGRPATTAPLDAIRYWAWANLRAAHDGARLGDRYLLVRLEDLCNDPRGQIERLCGFLDLPAGPESSRAQHEVQRPSTLGRWRDAPEDLACALERAAAPALRHFGYT